MMKPATKARRAAKKKAVALFRDWCSEYGALVDVEMAAGLVRRVTELLLRETAQSERPGSEPP
jgi:hypothetical protein